VRDERGMENKHDIELMALFLGGKNQPLSLFVQLSQIIVQQIEN
jgi:hypothetical protein